MPETTQIVATVIGTVETPPEGIIDETPQVSPEIQAEINRLNEVKVQAEKAAKEAEERALYWRKEKARERDEYFRDRGKPPTETPAPQVQDLGIGLPPDKSVFDDYDKYVGAVAEYNAKKMVAEKIAEWRREEEKKTADKSNQEKTENLRSKMNEGYSRYADFEEVVGDNSLPITPHIVDILAESESPADIAYYLGKNRGEAIRLSRLSPIQAAKEIGRIEMEIKKNPTQNIITNAPPPIKPVGSSETPVKDLEKLSQKEFEAEMVRRTGRRF